MVKHLPIQGKEQAGLRHVEAAEMPFLAFSSPSQEHFELEAGWGEQDPSLPSSAAASGAGAVRCIS